MSFSHLCGKQEKWTGKMVYKNQLKLGVKNKDLHFPVLQRN